MKKMHNRVASLIVATLLLIGGFTGLLLEVRADGATEIAIDPTSTTVSTGATFTLSVLIDPAQPLAGAQCNVEFDPSLLSVTDVSDGGMFDMWFDGLLTIDNTNGTIENIIAFNLGGTTSTSGTLAVIEFEAQSSAGTSDINLTNVEISDQNGDPVAYSVTNGSVTITSEVPILSRSPASHDFGDTLEGQTDSTTFEIWNSGAGTLTYSLSESCDWVTVSPTSGTSTGEHDTITVSMDTTGLSLGSHTCTIDISSDGGSSTFTVTVNVTEADLVPPTITDLLATPATQEAGNMVRLSAQVTDNVGVENVYLVVEYPNGSLYNISITSNKTGSTYYYEYIYPLLGTYNFSFYAVDTSGNGNTSAVQSFVIEDTTPPAIASITAIPNPVAYGGTINISAAITDVMGVAAVHLRITHPDDSVDNVTITDNVAGEDTYYYQESFNELGTYEYTFYAVDTTGNGNTSAVHTFTMQDKTPPQVEVVYPDGGENVSGDVLIQWNVTDNYDDPENLTVTLKYSADNGASWQNIASDLENTGEYEWDTTVLADGTRYRIKVNVDDTAGNTGTDISNVSFTVDNTAPSLTLLKPTPGTLYMFDREVMPLLFRNKAVIVGALTVSVEASDAPSGVQDVEFRVDGVSKFVDSSPPYEWEWDETVFCAHTLTVIVTDNAGNTVQETVEVKVYNI